MSTEEANAAPEGQNQGQGKPDEAKLKQSVAAARKAYEAQSTAAILKDRAKQALNPKEQFKLLQQAYDKEMESFGQSKMAKRLQSGAWQGGAAGGGIGTAVALGVGGVVGTLISGIVAVPTAGLGILTGAAVGSVHGSWLNLGKGNKDGEKTEAPKEDPNSAAMAEANKLDAAVEKGAAAEPVPPNAADFKDPEEGQSTQGQAEGSQAGEGTQTPKKKPRKLQQGSGTEAKPPTERKKPKKLEVRSGAAKPVAS